MNGTLLIILSQVMLGSVATFARWAGLPAQLIVLFRCLFGAISIGLFVLYAESIRSFFKWNKTLLLLILTGLFMASNWFFFFKAVLTTTITNSILLYNLAPIFVLISAILFLKEVPTVRQVICIGTSFLGVSLILSRGGISFQDNAFLGGLYALAGGALYAQVTILGRYLKQVPALVITFFQTAVGALLFLPISLPKLLVVSIGPQSWWILVAMGLFHTAIPYFMYFKALKQVKATIAGILQYIYTLSTIVFGVIFFHEQVTLTTILGGIVILVSSYVALKFPGSLGLNQLWSFRRARVGVA